MIGEWLGASTEMQPAKIKSGLRFPPQVFLWCDYGPDVFPGTSVKSYPDFPCPSKLCAGVYMPTTDSRGKPTSNRMTADFDLDAVPQDRKAVLDIEGQDAVSHWMDKRGLDWKTSIKVRVNDREIFAGECGFVRGNWSRRRFPVPSDCLKVGKNRLEIRNTSSRGWFAGCWFLLSDATLTFTEPQKTLRGSLHGM